MTVPGATPSLLALGPVGEVHLESPEVAERMGVRAPAAAVRDVGAVGSAWCHDPGGAQTGSVRDEGAAEIVGGPGGACEADGGAGDDDGCCNACGDVHAASRLLAAIPVGT